MELRKVIIGEKTLKKMAIYVTIATLLISPLLFIVNNGAYIAYAFYMSFTALTIINVLLFLRNNRHGGKTTTIKTTNRHTPT